MPDFSNASSAAASQPNRLPLGGRIDRARPLTMRLDDRPVAGFHGDTIASALLASGVSVVGRSFKYHRPRGIFSAGPEEPNALLQVGEGGFAAPNTPATMAAAADGLRLHSQNRFPSLQWDVGAASQLLAPFIAAGFYYKTFIGPGKGTKFWMFCEKFIRRAAGIGKAPDLPDPQSYHKVNGFCDVLAVGGGVAGLCAALAAARAGARVVVAEQHSHFGGAALANPANSETDRLLADLLAELQALPNAKLLAQTVAFGAYDHGVFGLIQNPSQKNSGQKNSARPGPSDPLPNTLHILRAKTAVLAAGAIERPPMFGGNDLPGVMLAESARLYAGRFAVLPGKNILVFANNDRAYAAAADFASLGATVRVVDPRKNPPGPVRALARDAGVEIRAGRAVLCASGFGKLRAATVGKIDGGRVGGALEKIPCDLLAVSAGWSPAIHLWSQRGGVPEYDEKRFAFLARPSDPRGFIACGLCAGAATLRESVASGFAAGKRAAAEAGIKGRSGAAPSPPENPPDALDGFAPPLFASDNWGEPRGKVFVDLQNDATVSDIRLAAREGYDAPEHLKRYTTIGMGTDQGKTANDNALHILAGENGADDARLFPTTFRPPYSGAGIGVLAGPEVGRRFRPFRLSPMHSAHLESGAKMIEAGLWLRPHYYPRGGETLAAAGAREAARVRESAGMVDVSTLGKIAVQGPDAAEFLNRVYANRWDALKIGRAKYGAMLREDGFVFDDGVTARLAADDFFMTTTTANAGPVLAHLEKLLQTRWPDLRAQVASVSDEWAAAAVAGPRSREWLATACDGADLSDAALPHMGFVWAEAAGLAVRIQRVSFSGERAYEVYARADRGAALWTALAAAGREVGGILYGSEALGILRIEKGHPAGPELDGRTTLRDLRLDRMAKKSGGFIGSALRRREFLESESRPVLVGLRSANPQEEIRAGSLLHSPERPLRGHGEGWISSAAWSPAVGGFIALGFLEDGISREGSFVMCANPLEGAAVRARVEPPCFVDAAGGRMGG